MPQENRTFAQVYASAPGVGTVIVDHWNELQDFWTFGWEMEDSELDRGAVMSGEHSCYGQFTCALGAHTLIDNSVDWRGRMLEIEIVGVANANELPQQINYDPDNVAGTWDWNLMFTGDGASLAAVPVGVYWNPPAIANVYVFASNAAGGGIVAGDLVIRNNGGAAVYVMVRAQRTSDVR